MACSDTKYLSECLTLLARKKVAVTSNHVFRLVAHPFINDALVHALGRTVGGEGMPQHVPTFDLRPFSREHSLKVIVSLMNRERADGVLRIPAS
jgi:hypothetical protein